MDKDLYDLPPEELKEIPTVCGSLREALGEPRRRPRLPQGRRRLRRRPDRFLRGAEVGREHALRDDAAPGRVRHVLQRLIVSSPHQIREWPASRRPFVLACRSGSVCFAAAQPSQRRRLRFRNAVAQRCRYLCMHTRATPSAGPGRLTMDRTDTWQGSHRARLRAVHAAMASRQAREQAETPFGEDITNPDSRVIPRQFHGE